MTHDRPTSSPRRTHVQSSRLNGVLYDIRGPVQDRASQLEAEGHRILRLNVGNPAAFGFEAPEAIVRDMIATMAESHGYSDSKGVLSARRAVVSRYEIIEGFPEIDVEDVYLGNGVSELISVSLQALLNPGDEVLVPSPDYPLWTASTSLAGGTAVHYLTDEDDDWNPSIADIEAKITPRTKAIVVINPNNPTGAVYPVRILDQIMRIAERHELIVFADEIYDRILYDGAQHTPIATRSAEVLCITYGGLSKSHRVAGYRSGWMIITGPRKIAKSYIEGLTLLSSMRLCANVPGQFAIQAALSGVQSIDALVAPGGRLARQRDVTVEGLARIDGVSCVTPQGALYVFPKLDPNVHEIHDDEQLMFDLLVSEQILLVQGTAFNWAQPDHLRIVTLPAEDDLADAIERLGNFLSSYRQ